MIFRGATLIASCLASQEAITGSPVSGYYFHQKSLPLWGNRRVRSVALRCAFWYCTSVTRSLADDLLLLFWPLVDPARFELATFSMPLRRAPNCAMGPDFLFLSIHCSGPGGIRTLDLFSAIEARSQLRYRPSLRVNKFYPSQL